MVRGVPVCNVRHQLPVYVSYLEGEEVFLASLLHILKHQLLLYSLEQSENFD